MARDAIKFTIVAESIKRIERAAKEYTRAQAAAMEQHVRQTTQSMEEMALRIVPVDKGDLQRSLGEFFEGEGMRIVGGVRSDATVAPHNAFVEFGTGQRGAGTPQGPIPSGYQHGAVPGMPAQPYMRTTFEAHRDGFERGAAKIVGR